MRRRFWSVVIRVGGGEESEGGPGGGRAKKNQAIAADGRAAELIMNPPSEAIKNEGAPGLLGFRLEERFFTMD
jgi:hypothetical protein